MKTLISGKAKTMYLNIESIITSAPKLVLNRKSKLTIKRPVQKVSIDSPPVHTQVVRSLQCIVAIVVMSWIFENETALDVVPIDSR